MNLGRILKPSRMFLEFVSTLFSRKRYVKGGGFRMQNTCTPMADSCQCMAKPIQYCKVKKERKKEKKTLKKKFVRKLKKKDTLF